MKKYVLPEHLFNQIVNAFGELPLRVGFNIVREMDGLAVLPESEPEKTPETKAKKQEKSQ